MIGGMIGPGIVAPGHRLPPATRLGRVRLQVADLGRSLDFYRDQIGFRLLARDSRGGTTAAVLGAPQSDEPLVVLDERRGTRPVPRGSLLGLYHFALLLPDRASLGRFVRHVGVTGIPVGAADHLVSEALYLTDPDGLQMEVYADRPRESWVVRGRELVMSVDPLDVPNLLSAAGDTRWSGVPAGSVIGHVHFHIGDLGQAEAFYYRGLGFDKVAWSLPGALFISAGGYHHHVGLNTWAAGAPPATQADARLLDWDLVLPDEGAVADAVRGLGDAGFRAVAGGEVHTATDPWGLAVNLVARPV